MFDEQNLLYELPQQVKHKTLYWLALAILEVMRIFLSDHSIFPDI